MTTEPTTTTPPTTSKRSERTVLLSRVAEAVYWTGRYLERAEATARIVKVHTEMFLDLPKSAAVGWSPLLAVTGSHESFDELYDEATEEHVVSFLSVDGRNRSSITASLALARENMRGTRSVFPREAWETLNHLFLECTERAEDAITRRRRLQWTDDVLADCQRLTGMLADTMSHDDPYQFLLMGRQLERADMTTRVLDVRAGTLIQAPKAKLAPYADLSWMSVLKSLAAHQMYRRRVQSRVRGAEVVKFLLQDPQFPRSVEHCLTSISRCLLELPHHEDAMAVCARAERHLDGAHVSNLAFGELHDYVDELQLALDELHGAVSQTYFLTGADDLVSSTPDGETPDDDSSSTQTQTQELLATA